MSNGMGDKSTFPAPEVKSSLDETSAGEVPDDWRRVRLEKLAQDTAYGASEAGEPFDPCKPRYIRIKDINELGRLKQDEKASLPRAKAEPYLLELGDMLFARSGSVGRTYLYNPDDGECCHGGYTIRHRFPLQDVNLQFIHQFTKSPFYWDWVTRISRTGAQPNINAREFASLLLPFPPVDEQRKIASVLYTVDQLMEKTERLTECMERVQRVLLYGLFGRGKKSCYQHDVQVVRIGPKEFKVPDNWQVVDLGSVGEVITGDTPATGSDANYGGELPFITPDDFGDGRYVNRGRRTLTAVGEREARPVPKDSLLVECIGKVGRVRMAGRRLATNQQINAVVVDTKIMQPEFLYYQLKLIEDILSAKAGQTTVPIISKNIFAATTVLLPPRKEQKRVVAALSLTDEILGSNRRYRRSLRRLKKGLMQDLLSGRVRTNDKDIEVIDEVAAYG